MVAVAEVVTLLLLAGVGVWRFRRTALYRARRSSRGVVLGQWSAWSSPKWYGGHPIPQRPELRGDEGSTGSHRWPWWKRGRRPA
jgi:hypothetical protein